MPHDDLETMSEGEHRAWLAQHGGVVDMSAPTEKNLVALFSTTLRETDPHDRAQGLVAVANMCLALADVTLGAQDYVATCVAFNKH